MQLNRSFDLSYFRYGPEESLLSILFDIVKELHDDLDLLILPAGLVRSMRKYKKGDNFSTYDLKSLFAFGLNLVFFKMNKKVLREFKDKFADDTGKGSYP